MSVLVSQGRPPRLRMAPSYARPRFGESPIEEFGTNTARRNSREMKKGDVGDANNPITPSPCCVVSSTFLLSLLARPIVYTHNTNIVSKNTPFCQLHIGRSHARANGQPVLYPVCKWLSRND